MVAVHGEALFDNISNRRFSGSGQPREPNDSWPLFLQCGALGLSNEMCLPLCATSRAD
jgi:hypothetical protein